MVVLPDAGLTVSQADVIFTLGNTAGMTCGEIGERTLITKGTLTGVIDRVSENIISGKYYQALKLTSELMNYEQEAVRHA